MTTYSKAPRGWVLKRGDNDQYVEAIIANGRPDNPIVYYTRDIQEAKVFLRCRAAKRRALQLGTRIMWFTTDNNGKRIEEGEVT